MTRLLSFVVPVFNEEDSVRPLYDRIREVVERIGCDWELLFVNDGSSDSSGIRIREICAADPRVGLIDFRRNYGKAAALDAGFAEAVGDVVFTLDADLQDDPEEIPRFLDALDGGGFDLVSGWKQVRHDPLDKTLPSRLFNAVVRRVSGVRLNDFNCGFKAYRVEVVRALRLYGELHRFIPVLASWRGFKVGEIAVNHHPRRFGRSKYGWSRIVKGFFDLLTVTLNTRFSTRPLHVFGATGAGAMLIGAVVLAYLTLLWLLGYGPIGTRPLLFFGLMTFGTGVQLLSVGLLAEFVHQQNVVGPFTYMVRELLPSRPRSRPYAVTTPTRPTMPAEAPRQRQGG